MPPFQLCVLSQPLMVKKISLFKVNKVTHHNYDNICFGTPDLKGLLISKVNFTGI